MSRFVSRRRLLFGAAAALLPTRAFATGSWVQVHQSTTVWAEPEGAKALAPAPQWTQFEVVGSPVKHRLPVFDPRLGTRAWVDGAAVGPSGPPAPTPVPAAPFASFWVAPHRPTPLLREPDPGGAPLALLPQFGPLRVDGPGRDGFLPVEEPFARVQGWVEADAVGRVGPPPVVTAGRWWGTVVAEEAFARAEPRRAAPVVASYPRGSTLGFLGWAEGEMVAWDDPTWGEIAPGQFVYGQTTRPIPLAEPPRPALSSWPTGRWIGVNRTLQAIVAYEDDRPLFWARTSTGRPGWETPLGGFEIFRRVAKETMDSRTLLGRDAERASYKIENVRFTQYFSRDGNAIHENWWKDPDTFGLPASHGCAGLRPEDAARFWEFGAVGMAVIVHA